MLVAEVKLWPRKLMMPLLYLCIIASMILWPTLLHYGNVDLCRWGLCIFFMLGALLSFIGYFRYIEPSRSVIALLALSISQSGAFSSLGLAFLVLAYFGAPQSSYQDPTLYFVYAFFGVAATVKAYKGLYLFFGAGRGWINTQVLWLPWVFDEPQDRRDKTTEEA